MRGAASASRANVVRNVSTPIDSAVHVPDACACGRAGRNASRTPRTSSFARRGGEASFGRRPRGLTESLPQTRASAASCSMLRASAPASPGGKASASTPGVTISAAPPPWLITTARPHAMPSAMRQAERFGLGAGVNHDIQRTNRRRRIVDEAREADAIREAEPCRRLAKLLDRHLAVLGLVHRSADHVGAHVQRGRQPGDRLEKDVVPLPPREGRDEAHAHDAFAGSGKSRLDRRDRACRHPARSAEVHGIPDRVDRRQRPAQAPEGRRRRSAKARRSPTPVRAQRFSALALSGRRVT